MSQFYVKASGAETADGPFSIDQLRELVALEIASPETLYRTEAMEDFEPLGRENGLWAQIKPQPRVALKLRTENNSSETTQPESAKKPLRQSAGKTAAPLSPTSESADIDEMLAAAEGNTAQTSHTRKLRKSRNRVIMLFLFIGGLIQPVWIELYAMIKSGDYSIKILIENWTLFFALADLFLVIAIGLGNTGLFPLLRFRAALGLGFFAYLFYSRGDPQAIAALTALQFGLLGSTLCTRFAPTLLMVTIGLAGGGFFIWLSWFKGMPL